MKTNKQNKKVEELGSQSALAAANTDATAAAAPARSDTRLPVDTEVRKQNRTLPTQTVVQRLAEVPAVAACARVVGAWVWVQFKEQPAAEIRQQLAQLGFHWNRTRQAWQHPCGKFSTGARQSDPRDTYASKPAMEAFN